MPHVLVFQVAGPHDPPALPQVARGSSDALGPEGEPARCLWICSDASSLLMGEGEWPGSGACPCVQLPGVQSQTQPWNQGVCVRGARQVSLFSP